MIIAKQYILFSFYGTSYQNKYSLEVQCNNWSDVSNIYILKKIKSNSKSSLVGQNILIRIFEY